MDLTLRQIDTLDAIVAGRPLTHPHGVVRSLILRGYVARHPGRVTVTDKGRDAMAITLTDLQTAILAAARQPSTLIELKNTTGHNNPGNIAAVTRLLHDRGYLDLTAIDPPRYAISGRGREVLAAEMQRI
jgi:hypothetical protein